ncbi:MAG: hypothetical protein IJ196_04545 [Prevotella sp.]|nr:hypothetical protein [Prevotella sp.]
MRLRTLTTILLAAVTLSTTAANKDKKQKQDSGKGTYIFGYATTFTDSVIYMTEIQRLDSAYILKNGFLYSRDSYSYYLHDHMVNKLNVSNAICAVSFAKKQKKIEKKYLSMRKKYANPKHPYEIKYINNGEFQFTAVPADETVLKKDAAWKAEMKAAKKKAKQEAKENKAKTKEAKNARKTANKEAIKAQKERHKQEEAAKK